MALVWTEIYDIIPALLETYPSMSYDQIKYSGFDELKELIVSLPDFCDDPIASDEDTLEEIQNAWMDEIKG